MPQRFWIGLLLLWLLFRSLIGQAMKKPTNIPKQLSQEVSQSLSRTKYTNLVNYWLALAKMETAGFTSRLWNSGNNPWGMRVPKRRITTVNGQIETPTNGTFGAYDSIQDAAQDIVLYMDAVTFPASVNNLTQFVKELGKRGYFGIESADSYEKKIKAWAR